MSRRRGKSPTQRSLQYMRDHGYTVQVVERWVGFGKFGKRQDLFGFIDIVAIKDDEIIGVQTTSYAGISSHRWKILLEPRAEEWVWAGATILLHGWKKNKQNGRYILIEEEMTEAVRECDADLIRRL